MQIDVSDYENWIGKTQEIEDKLEVSPLNRMAATLNEHLREYSIGDKIPTLWHWLYFLESTPQSMLATKITEKRESKSKPDRGIVWFEHVGINQRDEIICECLRKGMMLKKNA